MLSPTLRLLLLAALMLPAVLSAQDCHCRVTMKKAGYVHVPEYSPACYQPESACGITVDASGPISLYEFSDLRGDTIVVKAYNLPLFLSSTLVDNRTHFVVETDGEAYSALPEAALAVTLLGMLEHGLDYYNDLLRDCAGSCTLGAPSVSSVPPLTLASWTTEARNGVAHLGWKTEDETNNAYFLVRHSTDGRNYRNLGTVGGRGTTERGETYTYHHTPRGTGYHYYQLVQYSHDGSATELGVQVVSIGNKPRPEPAPLRQLPVATGQRVTLPAGFGEPTDVAIYGPTGEEIARPSVQQSAFRVPDLPPGTYTLRCDGVSSRLVVAR